MVDSRHTILVIEDERAIADTIVYALRTEGFAPLWRSTLKEAAATLELEPVDLVVLDVGLPDGNGFDFCREIRRRYPAPVIFLSARGEEVDRIVGLEIGADDYVVKPFSPRELTARVRVVLRRRATHEASPSPATAGWEIDAERCRIRFEGQALDLTRNEYRLLATLLARPGRVFSRDQLMQAAWEDPGSALERTVDAHVKSIRAKLRAAAPHRDPLETHRGLGYSLRETH